MQLLASIVLALLFVGSAQGQSLPAPLQSLVSAGSDIVKPRDLNSDQKHFLWEKSTRDRAGYLRVETGPAYLKLIDDFSKLVDKTSPPPEYGSLISEITRRGFPYIGILKENLDRTTIIFGKRTQGMLMLTVWGYSKVGARMIVVDEFLNSKVRGRRATLSLAVVPGLEKSLWKIAWLTKGNSYELYVTDTLSRSGTPSRTASEIVSLAELIDEDQPQRTDSERDSQGPRTY